MGYTARQIAFAPETAEDVQGAGTATETVSSETIPDKPSLIGEQYAPLGGAKITRMPAETQTANEAEDAKAADANAGGADEEAAKETPTKGEAEKKSKDDTKYAASEDDMADILAVFPKSRVDAAKERGPAAVEMLLEMARDELGRKIDDEPEKKPELEADDKTESKTDKAGAKDDPKSLVDEAELRSVLGDDGFDKGVKPLIDAIGKQSTVNQALHDLLMQTQVAAEQMVAGMMIDSWNDPRFGNQQEEELTQAQEKARQSLLREAATRIQIAAKNGKPISGFRAFKMARRSVVAETATKEATRDIQRQVVKRNNSVGAVPARAGGVGRAQAAAKGDEAALNAVQARLNALGIRE